MTALELGKDSTVGNFVIEAMIGTGGMSTVYRARQTGVERPVALKVLATSLANDPEYRERFTREAGITRDLEHPAVLPVYAAGEDGGLLYLATRLVPGQTLADMLSRGRPGPEQAVEILRSVAAALDHAHGRGVIHRDVKPSNVLIDPSGHAYLGDFGIAKVTDTALTATGHYIGTPRYMAPEQGGGTGLTYRADLYSLAVVAFETLTGRAPYTAPDTVSLLMAHASAPVPEASSIVPELPVAVDAVLARGLAKRPGARFRSGREFVAALETALARRPDRRRIVRGVPTRPSRRAAVTGAAAVVVTVAIVVGSLLVRPGSEQVTTVPVADDAQVVDTPPAPVDLADVPRQGMLYRASLDGTAAGLTTSSDTSSSSPREAVRHRPGALELEALAPGGETYTGLDLDIGVRDFLGEMDVSTRPGSDVELCWSLRWRERSSVADFVCFDTATGRAWFSVFRRGQGKAQIGPSATVAALPTGRTVHLAVLVEPSRFALYVDGHRVLDVVDHQVPPSRTVPGIELESTTGTGLVRIEGLRLFDVGER